MSSKSEQVKRRIEEIKDKTPKDKDQFYSIRTGKNGWVNTYTMAEDDFNFLVKKAERVEEFEQQNKRYREAIEKIKKKISKQLEGLDAEEEMRRVVELSELMTMAVESLKEENLNSSQTTEQLDLFGEGIGMNNDLYLEKIIEQAKKIGELEELVHVQGKFILKQSDKIEVLEPQNELYREIIRSSIDEISSKLGLDSEAYEALGILEEGLEESE